MPWRSLAAFATRLRAWFADGADRSIAQRMAGAAFAIRIGGAGLAYALQILLARWMGSSEFGIFVYVWTWVMLIGALVDIGLASAAQRFIPQYTQRGERAHLRGYLAASRWLTFGIGTAVAVAGALVVHLLQPWLDEAALVPLAVACICLPVYGVMNVQDGIARSYNWAVLALLPPYILRPLAVIALMGGAWLAGLPADAVTAIAIAAIALWLTALGQTLLLNRRLRRTVEPGERRYAAKDWFAVSVPMFAIDGLYCLLMYIDILMLKAFVTPEDIGIYYAASKTLALIVFVHFAVTSATAHRFSEYHVGGDRERLRAFLRDAVRWTFWPSLAAAMAFLALGWPLLSLFGKTFVSGYPLMFIFAVGLLARAAIGPAGRFLVMLGEQRACAFVAAAALATNLVLNLLLIPPFGVTGAAVALSSAYMLESILLAAIARRRLGFHLFIFGGSRSG
ncbi:MAG: flippase [Alphaproteobacteria bacterium]|nr:MAG: flippase [Alphaproteobacteria bacterium]